MTANILVVDDLEPNIKLLEAKLLKEYYSVYTANSGEKALQIVKSNKIDLILLDIMMPNMDGFELCKILKADNNTTHIPIIMITALSDIEDRIKGLEAGADEFLTKPINDTPLFARVKSLTRTKSLIDELTMRNQTNQLLGISTIEFKDDFSNTNILFINDDISQIKNINKILNKIVSNIKVISNNEQFEIFERDDSYYPDLIILNSHLESWDSLRICVTLKSKENLKNAAIMMITDEENTSKVIKGMELGVNDYFVYPVDENELIARIKTQLRRKKYQDDLRNFMKQSVNLAITDGLTNLYNRRYLDIYLLQMIKNSNEKRSSLCIVMFDIDDFKSVNDVFGHQEGDKLLKLFANILKESVRVTDLVARYGGEEFIALFKDTNLQIATDIAERVRKNIASYEILIGNNKICKTVSGGVTLYKFGENASELIERADRGLYQAKHNGCNKIVIL